jgi:hypothetical protein
MSGKIRILLCWCLGLLTAPGLHAATLSVLSDGSDGSFVPADSTTLSLDGNQVFNFTDIRIASGVTVDFDQGGLAVDFLGTGDITIAGTLDASLLDLVITTPGRLTIDGEILAGSLQLEATDILLTGSLSAQGELSLGAGNSITLEQDSTLSAGSGTLSVGDGNPVDLAPDGGSVLVSGPGIVLSPAVPITVVPVPAALWLFSSGLLGLAGVRGRKAA